jgi:spermidine synthase
MRRLLAIVGCLFFSGLAALVYQILWTRLLGFAFGTTTEAIGTVLALFFGGMALGSAGAARWGARLRRPLLVYAWLELGVGLFALASLPCLLEIDDLYARLGAAHGPVLQAALRVGAAGVVLLPPTLAMGATLPVVARALVVADATLGRWSALLYAANTFGAVLGAYLCGFWLIPGLGLARTVLAAAATNLAVAGAVGVQARRFEGPAPAPAAPAPPDPERRRLRRSFLACFGVSGFVAIGYEIVWARVFGIVMEGTLYGFAAVLTCFLLGLALGSLAAAPRVDRLRDLPRAFGWLHAAIAASVALGLAAVPILPFLQRALASALGPLDPLHGLFLVVAPIVLVPTALFGAAFPLFVRLYAGRAAQVGEGMGLASAVNTAGSILASLAVGFWALPALGMDATLFALVVLDLGVALFVLLGFQTTRGRARLASSGGACLLLLALSLSFNGVGVEEAIAGREVRAPDLARYRQALAARRQGLALVVEGRSSIVTVTRTPQALLLRTNGLPEGGLRYDPPYYTLETVLLGVLPYLLAETPRRALVVGLGGGNTLAALLRTPLERIDVVELERGVAPAVAALHAGRRSPLAHPRVRLRFNDGRHELLLARHRGGGGFDVIASQPSHPWLQGAANLFTEEYFELARANLSEGGVFALWLNGFRTDAESVLAVVTSFERVFPGALLVNGVRDPSRSSLLLLGGRRALRVDLARVASRLAEPGVAELLALFGIDGVEALLALCEGPAAGFAAIAPDAANTDDNAFVETRIPRRSDWTELDFAAIERALSPEAPVLPPLEGPVDVARIARELLAVPDRGERWRQGDKVLRLLRAHGAGLPADELATLRAEVRLRDPATRAAGLEALRAAAAAHPASAAPWRALGLALASRERRWREAAAAFAEAFAREGLSRDAWDAGRSLHPVDRAGAWAWFERIPAAERGRYPRLAYYRAERALDERHPPDVLRARRRELERFRDTEEGRRWPGVDALLARLAEATGDVEGARRFADAAHRERLRRAEPALARAREALGRGALGTARTALEDAEALAPDDPRALWLRAEIALRGREPAAVAEALRRLRRAAPSLAEGVGAENRLRAAHGLPLLPDLPAEALAAQDAAPLDSG